MVCQNLTDFLPRRTNIYREDAFTYASHCIAVETYGISFSYPSGDEEQQYSLFGQNVNCKT